MHFLPDVYVPCDVCAGKRFNRETLDIRYKGRTIHEVLEMTVEEARSVFDAVPAVARKLQTLVDVGLSYVHLGQRATTLSGGEAQRVKLSRELSKRDTGRTLYILDEPTTGLHFHDTEQLLHVLHRLRDSRQHRGRHRAQPRSGEDRGLDRGSRTRGRRPRRAGGRGGHSGDGVGVPAFPYGVPSGGDAARAHRDREPAGGVALQGRQASELATVREPALAVVQRFDCKGRRKRRPCNGS